MLVSVLAEVRESRLKSCFGVAHRRRIIRAVFRRLILIPALALVVLAATPERATACLCGSPEEGRQFSTVAFTGVVVDTHDPYGGSPYANTGDPILYAFAVEESLKGDPDPVTVVLGPRAPGSGSCGVAFAIGERWSVYAGESEDALWTNSCSGNELLASGITPPAIPGGSPLPPDVGLVPDALPRLPFAVIAGLLGFGIVAYVAGSSRGSRRRRGGTGSAQSPG
jgi:hypothetical protein